MKKRSMMLVTSMMLAVLLIAGGTFAWFTATAAPKVNNFKAGTMDLEIIDIFEGAPKVNPGDCYSKLIYVKNTGTKKAYIRIKADAVWTPRSGINASQLSNSVLSYGINDPINWGPINLVPGWTEKDGYFYYNRIVMPGSYTKPLLKCNRICFKGDEMGNEYQGAELDITINAESIQATNGAVQAEWGITFPTVVPYARTTSDTPSEVEILTKVEEMLTEQDVLDIIAIEEAAFVELGLE